MHMRKRDHPPSQHHSRSNKLSHNLYFWTSQWLFDLLLQNISHHFLNNLGVNLSKVQQAQGFFHRPFIICFTIHEDTIEWKTENLIYRTLRCSAFVTFDSSDLQVQSQWNDSKHPTLISTIFHIKMSTCFQWRSPCTLVLIIWGLFLKTMLYSLDTSILLVDHKWV